MRRMLSLLKFRFGEHAAVLGLLLAIIPLGIVVFFAIPTGPTTILEGAIVDLGQSSGGRSTATARLVTGEQFTAVLTRDDCRVGDRVDVHFAKKRLGRVTSLGDCRRRPSPARSLP